MTEKRQLREQMATHTYWQDEPEQFQQPVVREPVMRPVSRREPSYETRRYDAVEVPRTAPRTLRQVMTTPTADPSMAWNTFAQRKEQMRRAQSKPSTYSEMVPRTYAQTGMRASSGRIPAVKLKRLPQYNSSPIPVRSGHAVARRNWFWRLVGFLFGTVAIILAATFAFTSNAFRVEQVNVQGTHNQALIDSIQSMGMRGQNIFRVNVTGFTDKVETSPLVASASLAKDWPNQLTVTIIERTPVLLWQTTQGTYSMDSHGVVIAPASESAGAVSLKTVIDTRSQAKGNSLHPGMHLNQTDITFATSVFNRLPQLTGITAFKLRYDVSQSGNTSYVIESTNGWSAYLGAASDTNSLDNRLLELQSILFLAQKHQLSLATIDLRYGLHPVYTLKN